MSEDDAEARIKSAAALRKQIAELAKGGRSVSAGTGDAAPPGTPAQPGRPDADAARGGDLSGEASEEIPSGGKSSEDHAVRRDAPRVYPQSPRDFVARRMKEIDHGRDDEKG